MKKILFISALSMFTNAMASSPVSFTCKNQEISIHVNSDWQYESTSNNWKNYWGTAYYSLESVGKTYSGIIPTYIMQIEDQVLWVSLLDPEEAESRRADGLGGSVGFAAIDYRDKLQDTFVVTLQKLKFTWADTGVDLAGLPNELNCKLKF